MVLAIDDDVVRLVPAAFDRPDVPEARENGLAEIGNHDERVEGRSLLPTEPMLAALDVGPVGVSNLHERGDPIVDQDDLEGWAVVVIPADHLGTHADRVLRKAHALGNVLLEHEPEAASLLEPVDLGSQVGAQGGVLDLVQEDVEFASDHAVSLSAGRHRRDSSLDCRFRCRKIIIVAGLMPMGGLQSI